MLGGLAILLGFLTLGELISVVGVGLPGNVIGMLLLATALATGVVPLCTVEKAAKVLLDHLAFLFVPAGVGVMAYAGMIADNAVPIVTSLLVGTILVLIVAGGTAELVIRRRDRRKQAR